MLNFALFRGALAAVSTLLLVGFAFAGHFPADSGVIDVTAPPYNVVPNDNKDATAAIQKALDDYPAANRIIYLPAGVYTITDTLKWSVGNPGDGDDAKRTILEGDGPDRTILRVPDGQNGFSDPAKPRAVINTGFKPAQRFRNGVRSLAIDVGKGNPGAIGLQFNASNQGSVRDLRIIAGEGSGAIGLDLGYTDEIGPLLVKNVEINGFEIGVSTRHAVNSITFEGLHVQDQRKAGWINDAQVVSVRKFSSRQRGDVPALANTSEIGVVTLIEAEIKNETSSSLAGVINKGRMLVRDSSVAGYRVGIESAERTEAAGAIREWVSHPVVSAFASGAGTLRLPIKETPADVNSPLEKWAGPHQFGGSPEDKLDDTEAVQKAIDSGAETIYFPQGKGKWIIDGELLVRGKVARLTALEGGIVGKGKIRIVDSADGPAVVHIDRIETSYQKLALSVETSRTVVISGCLWGSGVTRPGKGDLFVEDFCGGPLRFNGGNIWARQLNFEPTGVHLGNDGANVWVLGYKTERPGELVECKNGGRTEILGLFAYATSREKIEPMFSVDSGSALSVTYGESCFNGKPFWTVLKETREGETRYLYKNQLNARSGGSMAALLTAYPPSSSSAQTTPLPQIPPPASVPTTVPTAAPRATFDPKPAAGIATFADGKRVVEPLDDLKIDKSGRINGVGGWVADKPDGVTLVSPAGQGNPSTKVLQIRGTGNSTDAKNYRVAEKAFANPEFADTDIVCYSAMVRPEPGAYGVPAWETNVGLRVPRRPGQPLTKSQYAHPEGLGVQFGTVRASGNSASAVPFFIRSTGGAKEAQASEQGATPGHWYELRLVIVPGASGDLSKATASLFYRDLSAGEKQFSASSLQAVPIGLSASNRPALWSVWVVQGKFSGQYSDLAAIRLDAPPAVAKAAP